MAVDFSSCVGAAVQTDTSSEHLGCHHSFVFLFFVLFFVCECALVCLESKQIPEVKVLAGVCVC